MEQKKDHPGVYPPPPLFYVVIFFLSLFLQKLIPLSSQFFGSDSALFPALLFLFSGLIFLLPALFKFFKTKNTLITIKPANSLQTTGIYGISRNPMYVGLLAVYIGIAFLKGNLWTFILIPLVILVITRFVIINEEKYLTRNFGKAYGDYLKKTRRWI